MKLSFWVFVQLSDQKETGKVRLDLGRDRLLQRLLGNVATHVPLAAVAALIAVNRLVEPAGSGSSTTALPQLLDYAPRDGRSPPCIGASP